MKLHRTLVQTVIETLQQIFVAGVYADKAVEVVLKQNPRWGSRDRRFIAETTYEMVRWWRYISKSLSTSPRSSLKNTPLHMERGRGEVDEISASHYYKLFATWQILKGVDLPDWKEFSGIDKSQIIKNAEQVKLIRKYRESVPDWLDELGAKELGEAVWEKEIHELNTMAQVVLRVNTLKTTVAELQKKFKLQNIEVETISNSPLRVYLERACTELVEVLKERGAGGGGGLDFKKAAKPLPTQ